MVFLQKCYNYDKKNILNIVKELFEKNGGIDKYSYKGANVVIKPNLVSKKKPEEAATTHPSLVYAVAKLCIENGAKVTIAESPGNNYDKNTLKSIYKATGMEQVAEETGAILNYDLSVTEVDNPNALSLKKIKVITPVAKADIVINIAKLKTHGMMVYTGAVKNTFGYIAGLEKAEYHFKNQNYDQFANAIIDIHLARIPDLNIIDAVVGMERDGPTAGDPKPVNLVFSGSNAFEVDLTALGVININPTKVPIFKNAYLRKLCAASYLDIEIKGCIIDEVKVNDFIVCYNENFDNLYFFKGIMGNAISKLITPKPVFNKKKCRACGECVRACPAKVIKITKNKYAHVDTEKCIRCYCCQELCPFKAVSIKKPLMNKLFISHNKVRK